MKTETVIAISFMLLLLFCMLMSILTEIYIKNSKSEQCIQTQNECKEQKYR